ncbi:MAG: hypothetical protein ABI461_19300, partial [Polyangiaceae bacterium]
LMFLFRQRAVWVGACFGALFLVRGSIAHGDDFEKDDQNFRKDVIECENASAHLRSCCPSASSAPDCHYYHYKHTVDCGCESGSYVAEQDDDRPLSIDESEAIQNSSCDELVANGDCDKQWPDNATTSGDSYGAENQCSDE